MIINFEETGRAYDDLKRRAVNTASVFFQCDPDELWFVEETAEPLAVPHSGEINLWQGRFSVRRNKRE